VTEDLLTILDFRRFSLMQGSQPELEV